MRRKKGQERTIAKERIAVLFERARTEALGGRVNRADRYVVLARKLGTRYNVRLPPAYRRAFCHGCGGYLLPAVNATVRVRRQRVIVHCARCGHVDRFPYRRERSVRRLSSPSSGRSSPPVAPPAR